MKVRKEGREGAQFVGFGEGWVENLGFGMCEWDEGRGWLEKGVGEGECG